MSLTPPGIGAPPQSDPLPEWRDNAMPLDYEDHDIYLFQPPQVVEMDEGRFTSPAEFGDVNPCETEPDPDVWPLEKFDPGAPADVDSLIPITNDTPVPHVAWVTPQYLEEMYGYLPYRVKVKAWEVPPWKSPPNSRSDRPLIAGPGTPSMELTEQRKTALERHVRFWNGEFVRGNHILADGWPDFHEIFGDLDDDELRRLFVDDSTPASVIEAFREYPWFTKDTSIFLRPQYIRRKKVWYSPTPAAKALMNNRSDLPSYRGDPREALSHRITVGLTALKYELDGWEVTTYESIGDYTVDFVARKGDRRTFIEIITGHNNWDLHEKTYKKLADLNSHGHPRAAFDTRNTAYTVMNYWMNQGLSELPNGTFTSHPNLEVGRGQVQRAYENEDVNWILNDWYTTDKLWRMTLGDEGPDVQRATITSLNW